MEKIHIRVPIGQSYQTKKIRYLIPSASRPYHRKRIIPFYDSDDINGQIEEKNLNSQSDDDMKIPTGTVQSPSKQNLLDMSLKEKRRLKRLQEKQKRQEKIQEELLEPIEEVKSLRKTPKQLDRRSLEKLSKKGKKKESLIQTQDVFPTPAKDIDDDEFGPPVESLRRLHARRANSVKRAPRRNSQVPLSPQSAKSLNLANINNNLSNRTSLSPNNESEGGVQQESNVTSLRKRRRSSSVHSATKTTLSKEREEILSSSNAKKTDQKNNIRQSENNGDNTDSVHHKRRRSSSAKREVVEEVQNNILNSETHTSNEKPQDTSIEVRPHKRRRSSSARTVPSENKKTEPPPLETHLTQSPPPKLNLHTEPNNEETPQKRRSSSAKKPRHHKFLTHDSINSPTPKTKGESPRSTHYRDGRAQTLDPDDYKVDIMTSPLKPQLMERLEREPRKMRLSADDLFLELLNESDGFFRFK